ncbi:uncharacterized protein N7518_005918, partial [Penicillium psychrosexuale]|uniref:uncharacterized protein n=1 Tax=Penicillium psychrosexuale TaxID=1002107 RepID=UPI002545890E
MEEWYTNITIPDFRIKPTPKGWIDNDTVFEWLCSFYKAIKNRVKKLNDKLLNDLVELDDLSIHIKRHIRRSINASSLLAQRLEICEVSLKKSQDHRSRASAPKNRKSILNA